MAALTPLTRDASSAVPHGRKAGGSRVEEDFPAAPKEPKANPWLPETHEHAGRPRGPSPSSAQRAQEAHRERAQEVGPVSEKGRHERLGRGDRLQARSCFLAAQRRGRRIPGRNLVVYALSRPEPERKQRSRIGITVSKKVGNAVVRNRVKRGCAKATVAWPHLRLAAPTLSSSLVLRRHTAHTSGRPRNSANSLHAWEVREIRTLPGQSDSSWFRASSPAWLPGCYRAGHRSGLSLHSFLFGLRRRSRRAMGSGARRDLGFAPRASLPPLRARWSGSGSHCLGRVQIA